MFSPADFTDFADFFHLKMIKSFLNVFENVLNRRFKTKKSALSAKSAGKSFGLSRLENYFTKLIEP